VRKRGSEGTWLWGCCSGWGSSLLPSSCVVWEGSRVVQPVVQQLLWQQQQPQQLLLLLLCFWLMQQ